MFYYGPRDDVKTGINIEKGKHFWLYLTTKCLGNSHATNKQNMHKKMKANGGMEKRLSGFLAVMDYIELRNSGNSLSFRLDWISYSKDQLEGKSWEVPHLI